MTTWADRQAELRKRQDALLRRNLRRESRLTPEERDTRKRRAMAKLPLVERFEARLKRGADCWLWQGTTDRHGYGRIGHQGRALLVHRLAWELVNGPIPDGMCVLHHCDNPPCARIEHLYIGTHQQNMADRDARGGRPRGARNGRAKLTREKAREIRRRVRHGESFDVLAEAFGVAPATIDSIVRGRTWKRWRGADKVQSGSRRKVAAASNLQDNENNAASGGGAGN